MLTLRNAKRVFIAIVGGTVLLLGVAMIILPGPAFLVIPAGLGILAIEFAWARHWLHKTKEYMGKARNRMVPKDDRDVSPTKSPPAVRTP